MLSRPWLCGALVLGFGAFLGLSWASSNRLNLQEQSNGIAVLVDGKQVGFATSFNFASTTGMVQVCSASGGQVSCAPSYNTALIVTKQNLQAGTATRCVSTNGTFGYTCGTCLVGGAPTLCAGGLNPIATPSTVTPGMELEFIPDVPCAATQNCTLNVDNTGMLTIKANDGGGNGVAISGNGHTIHRLGVDQISGQLVWRLIY